MKNVICCKCTLCGKENEATPTVATCDCSGILDVIYDYDYIKTILTREFLTSCPEASMWRYRALLPVESDSPTSPLRVGFSPFYKGEKLGKELGLTSLYIKDDGVNPTASLKDRASAIAVTKAIEAGFDTISCSSTGNAASSLAGNAAAAGLKTYIFVPERAPKGKVAQLLVFGANVISVQGDYGQTFELSKSAIEKYGWYNRNAAINPYLSEGKKTVSLEICEQMEFKAPDFVAVSVGDGCTIAGVWKGFKDMFALGLIDKLPRLISVQAEGCCPTNTAFETGKPLTPQAENTFADSIAVGIPRNPHKALLAIKESNGLAINVSDTEILEAMFLLGRTQGVFGEPAGVTATAGIKKAVDRGLIPKNAKIVSIVTGNGLKDTDSSAKMGLVPEKCSPDINELTFKIGK